MATILNWNMPQPVTYWPPAGNDGFGDKVYSSAVLAMCRWQDKAALFRDRQGREVTSQSIVYVSIDVVVQGYLALGDHTQSGTGGLPADPRRLAGLAFEVRQVDRSPSLSNDKILIKAYL